MQQFYAKRVFTYLLFVNYKELFQMKEEGFVLTLKLFFQNRCLNKTKGIIVFSKPPESLDKR